MAGESFFETVVENESLLTDSFSGTYLATDHTTSPWHPDYQHGGPVSALLARAIGKLEMPIEDPVINRVTVDIMAPIPKGAIAISARVVKAGRLTTLVEADLSTAALEYPVVRMSAWCTRRLPRPLTHAHGQFRSPPPAGTPALHPQHWGSGYLDAVEWRSVSGGLDLPGPGTVWANPRIPLVDDERARGTSLLLLIADAGAGVSYLADPTEMLFLNTDLSLNVIRVPGDGPIWMSSESWIDVDGIGLASSVLGDSTGSCAVSSQSLFVAEADELNWDIQLHPHIASDQ